MWAITIAILTLIPGKSLGGLFIWKIPYFDKLAHSSFYLILSFLTFLPKKPDRWTNASFTLYSLLFLLLFGSTLELLQYYVPNRTFDLIDIAANMIGVILGMILANYFKKYRILIS